MTAPIDLIRLSVEMNWAVPPNHQQRKVLGRYAGATTPGSRIDQECVLVFRVAPTVILVWQGGSTIDGWLYEESGKLIVTFDEAKDSRYEGTYLAAHLRPDLSFTATPYATAAEAKAAWTLEAAKRVDAGFRQIGHYGTARVTAEYHNADQGRRGESCRFPSLAERVSDCMVWGAPQLHAKLREYSAQIPKIQAEQAAISGGARKLVYRQFLAALRMWAFQAEQALGDEVTTEAHAALIRTDIGTWVELRNRFFRECLAGPITAPAPLDATPYADLIARCASSRESHPALERFWDDAGSLRG